MLIVDAQGGVHALYSEAIDLACLGSLSIRRASHVEPDEHGQWWADLAPVNGPTLGPFMLRSGALDAERDWLETHCLQNKGNPSGIEAVAFPFATSTLPGAFHTHLH